MTYGQRSRATTRASITRAFWLSSFFFLSTMGGGWAAAADEYSLALAAGYRPFDCAAANGTVENSICANSVLKRRIETLDSSMLKLMAGSRFDERKRLISDRNDWLSRLRDQCDLADPNDVTDCIIRHMDLREAAVTQPNSRLATEGIPFESKISKLEGEFVRLEKRWEDQAARKAQEREKESARARDQEERRAREARQSAPDEFAPDVLVFALTKTFPNAVQASFYSQNSNRAWPGGGSAYVVGSEIRKYRLHCVPGELICVGAWAEDTPDSWGVGPKNKSHCSDCCVRCGSRRVYPFSFNGVPTRTSRNTGGSNVNQTLEILGGALGVAAAIAGSGGGGGTSYRAPPPSSYSVPRNRESGVSGGR